MGLFGNKLTEEEKQKNKQEDIQLKEEFKKLTSKVIPHSLNIIQDSDGLAQPKTMLFLFTTPEFKSYISYTPIGKVFKAQPELQEYHVINFEWLEEIESKGKKVIGRSIAGALLAGPAGMIVGGVTGKTKKKDKSTAVLTLQNMDTKDVRMLSFECDQRKMKKFKMIRTLPLEEKEIKKTPIEQLKEYKELLDLEVITKEEYDKKKLDLLN